MKRWMQLNLTLVLSTVMIGCSTVHTRFSSSPSEVECLFPSTRYAGQQAENFGEDFDIAETGEGAIVFGPVIGVFALIPRTIDYASAIVTDVLLLPMDGYWVWRKSPNEEGDFLLSINQEYDAERNGIRLILRYHKTSESFIGMVFNVTQTRIQAVRVEVHLIDGSALGPTPRIDLAPGQKGDIFLSTSGQSFKLWKAYIESDGNVESEHSREGEYN